MFGQGAVINTNTEATMCRIVVTLAALLALTPSAPAVGQSEADAEASAVLALTLARQTATRLDRVEDDVEELKDKVRRLEEGDNTASAAPEKPTVAQTGCQCGDGCLCTPGGIHNCADADCPANGGAVAGEGDGAGEPIVVRPDGSTEAVPQPTAEEQGAVIVGPEPVPGETYREGVHYFTPPMVAREITHNGVTVTLNPGERLLSVGGVPYGDRPADTYRPVNRLTARHGQGYHTHKCTECGRIWGHTHDEASGDPRAHNCPDCGAFQNVIHSKGSYPTPARSTRIRVMPQFQVMPQFRPFTTSGPGCVNGNCFRGG